ncbi:LysR family transcriptional regulator [Rheinheimera sp.]|uniref:LysR family transcriptional regulator n=1 Tax=Rheinheimera sp. TaxID=1869214 RepID=UPI00307F423F
MDSLDLNALPVFFALAGNRSFTATAQQLGLTKTKVSLKIKALEQQLGVQLFRRTTRQVSLTTAGEQLYQHTAPLMSNLQQQLWSVQQGEQQLAGSLCISAPEDYCREVLVPLLAEFAALHPALHIELKSSDQVKDLIREGIDLTVRVGWLKDSSQKAQRIGHFEQWLVASPAYLQRHGEPKQPADLAEHAFISFSLLPSPLLWSFQQGEKLQQQLMKSRFSVNSSAAVSALVLQGVGLGVLTHYSAGPLVEQTKLVRLLADWQLQDGGIYLVYPPGDHRPAKVRLFVQFLRQRLGGQF